MEVYICPELELLTLIEGILYNVRGLWVFGTRGCIFFLSMGDSLDYFRYMHVASLWAKAFFTIGS